MTTTPTTTPGSTGSGLLAAMQEFLQREFGATLDDSYSAIALRPPIKQSFWAPGDRYLAQLPARRALFDSIFHGVARLWVITLNVDPQPYLRGPHQLDRRSVWTSPDWTANHEHALYGVEAAPAAIDGHGLIDAAAQAGGDGVIVLDPDRKIGFRAGSVSTPSMVFATSQADLDRLLVDKPDGHWF